MRLRVHRGRRAAERSRSPPASSSASARRSPSASTRCSPSAAWPASTATSRRSSSRTSGPSRAPRCAPSPDAEPTTSTWRPSPSPGWCSARGCGSRCRRTCPTPQRLRPAAGRRRRRLGRRLAADAGPREPRAALAAPRRPGPAGARRPGFELTERLTVHPEYVTAGEPWLDPRVAGHVARARRPGDRAGERRRRACPVGRPWQEPDPEWGSSGRIDLHVDGRHRPGAPATAAATSTPSTATGRRCGTKVPPAAATASARGAPTRLDADVAAALRAAERDPAALTEDQALALVHADGAGARRARPDRRRPAPRGRRRRRDLRRQPEHQLHQRLLHRLPVLRVRAAAQGRRRVHALARRGRRPRRGGLAARRHRGLHAGRHRPAPARRRRTSTSPAR